VCAFAHAIHIAWASGGGGGGGVGGFQAGFFHTTWHKAPTPPRNLLIRLLLCPHLRLLAVRGRHLPCYLLVHSNVCCCWCSVLRCLLLWAWGRAGLLGWAHCQSHDPSTGHPPGLSAIIMLGFHHTVGRGVGCSGCVALGTSLLPGLTRASPGRQKAHHGHWE